MNQFNNTSISSSEKWKFWDDTWEIILFEHRILLFYVASKKKWFIFQENSFDRLSQKWHLKKFEFLSKGLLKLKKNQPMSPSKFFSFDLNFQLIYTFPEKSFFKSLNGTLFIYCLFEIQMRRKKGRIHISKFSKIHKHGKILNKPNFRSTVIIKSEIFNLLKSETIYFSGV